MKTLVLPGRIDDDLAKAAEELSFMAKKPISKSMALNLLIEVYHAHLNNTCALDAFSQQLQSLNIMSPEEFDRYWDEPAKPEALKTKDNPRNRKESTKNQNKLGQ
jgi:hypothetical protein